MFVWVNSHHNIRFFDNRPETDGSLREGVTSRLVRARFTCPQRGTIRCLHDGHSETVGSHGMGISAGKVAQVRS